MYFCRRVACENFRAQDSILCHPCGGILGRPQIWGRCMSPKPLSHWATQQFIGNLTCMYFCRRVACKYFGVYETIPCRPRGGILGQSQTWGQCTLSKPLGHRATQQFIRNVIYMYFCCRVHCEYFSAYRTQSHVVDVMGFGGGPQLEAKVHRLNASANRPQNEMSDVLSNTVFVPNWYGNVQW